MLLVLSGCEKYTPGHLRFGVTNLAENFDPRYATDAASERVNKLLYHGLIRFDEQRKPIPDLATWKREAPNRYRLTLRDSVPPFSDGTPMTMQDVAATYQFILDENNSSPHRSTLALIDHIDVVDDRTLDFILTRPDPLFPSYLVIGIAPWNLLSQEPGHDLRREPLGNGAFTLHKRDASSLLLKRRGSEELIEFVKVQDPSIRVLKLMRGEIQLLQNDLSPSLVEYLLKQDGIHVETTPGGNFSYLGFNLEDPVSGDIRIRKAIALAIDREAIIRHVFLDRARAANGLFPAEHWLSTPDLPMISRNIDKARQLLKMAGYDSQNRLNLVYKTSSDPFRLRLATIIQHQLAEIGIDIEIKSYDWGTFYGDIKAGNFQIYSLTWVGLKTPDSYRYLFHSDSMPPDGANRGRYNSTRMDSLIESAEAESTIDAQMPLYHRLQHLLLEDLPYVPLWYEDQVVAWRDGVVGYKPTVDGNYNGLEDTHWNPLNTSK